MTTTYDQIWLNETIPTEHIVQLLHKAGLSYLASDEDDDAISDLTPPTDLIDCYVWVTQLVPTGRSSPRMTSLSMATHHIDGDPERLCPHIAARSGSDRLRAIWDVLDGIMLLHHQGARLPTHWISSSPHDPRLKAVG